MWSYDLAHFQVLSTVSIVIVLNHFTFWPGWGLDLVDLICMIQE